MRKFSRRFTSGVLAAAMMLPSISMPAAAETVGQETYKIYPTPHSVVYSEGTAQISESVNLVFSAGVDEFTRKHAKDVFELIGSTTTVSAQKEEGKTNVLVGITGEDSLAKTYFDEKNSIQASDLFEKTDAYALEIDGSTIAVLGVSSDAAFYGLTSLKHIFKQVSDKTVRNLLIEDYADVKTRGFIEGYYGNPWSFEDRIDLMHFGGDYKLNGYFYAPKDDPKHNRQWRELYTEEELVNHQRLAQAGNESKCYYIYAIHPFMSNAIRFDTDEHYQEDLNIIKTKFEQMMSVGVKQFAILADDAAVPAQGESKYVTLMTDLTSWLIEKQASVPGLKKDMIFCPNDYMGNGSSSQMQTLKGLPDSVSIIETGGDVWGTVGPAFNNTFYSNMGRPAFMWINWPCSDNTKDGLIMGGAERFLKAGTNPSTVDGIVLNPMQQSEPSKEGIFTNADYAWNIWESDDEYAQVWNDSFSYMDHGTKDDTPASAALRELSKHMKHSNAVGNTESEDLKPLMDSFLSKLQNDEDYLSELPALRAEFVKLHDAALTYKEQAGNKRTLGQIIYWIDAWEDTTNAITGYLDTLSAINDNRPLNEIWDTFSTAQSARDNSETHTFNYIDHDEAARPGRRYVTPFMNSLDSAVSSMVLPMINPNLEMARFVTSRTDAPTGAISNVFDGNASTQIIYKTPNTLSQGDYVGIVYTSPIDVNEVKILLGQSGNLGDTFSKAKLQYTQDGKNWIDFGEELTSPQEISHSNMGLRNVLGIRVYSTSDKTNTWLGVRDFLVNPKAASTVEASVTLPSGSGIYSTYTIDKMYDGDDSTFCWTNQDAKADDAITWNFGKAVQARNVVVKMGVNDTSSQDKWNHYCLETSVDGTAWTMAQEWTGSNTGMDSWTKDLGGITVQYVRLRNLEAKSKWVKITEFTVDVSEGDPYTTEHLYTNQSDTNLSVYFTLSESRMKADGDVTLQPGQYVGMDLERITDLIALDKGTDNTSVTLESSRNGYEWFEVTDPNAPAAARYVRLINKTDSPMTFSLEKEMRAECQLEAKIVLDSSDIGKDASYGKEDNREQGGIFDGDLNTVTTFADYPRAGQYALFDLGQSRTIKKLALYVQDLATNYLRDGKIQISADKENWIDVIVIGDGVKNTDDFDTAALNSDAGYTASSTYPNKVVKEGSIEPTQARYLRILYTADNDNRFVNINEIVINDGEYVPICNPAFRTDTEQKQGFIPANMTDGDLSTAWSPASDAAGYIEYDYSDSLEVNHFNIVQKGDVSHAKVSARIVKDGETIWKDLGTLDQTLSQFAIDADKVLTIRMEWEQGAQPVISEIIAFSQDIPELDTVLLEAALAKADSLSLHDFQETGKSDLLAKDTGARSALAALRSQEDVDANTNALAQALLAVRKAPTKTALDSLH